MQIQILKSSQVTPNLQEQLTQLYLELNDELKQLPIKDILQNNNQTDIVIAVDNDKPVGIAMMAKYKVISGYKGMIEDVVVSKEFRGKGIGRQLMKTLLELAEKERLNDVLLFSGHHRLAAIKLYKSLGFKLKESGLYIKKYVD